MTAHTPKANHPWRKAIVSPKPKDVTKYAKGLGNRDIRYSTNNVYKERGME